MKVRRDLLKEALKTGAPLYTVIDRAVGKTTQAIFRGIADSYDNLGLPVIITDPDNNTVRCQHILLNDVQRVLHETGLNTIEAKRGPNGTVVIINTFAEYLVQPSHFQRK